MQTKIKKKTKQHFKKKSFSLFLMTLVTLWNVSVCVSNAIKPNPFSAWHTSRVSLCDFSTAVVNWFSLSPRPWAPYRLESLRGALRDRNSPNSSCVCMCSHSGHVCGGRPRGAALWTRVSQPPCADSALRAAASRACAAGTHPAAVGDGWQILTSRGLENAASVCGGALGCISFESCATGHVTSFGCSEVDSIHGNVCRSFPLIWPPFLFRSCFSSLVPISFNVCWFSDVLVCASYYPSPPSTILNLHHHKVGLLWLFCSSRWMETERQT